MNRTAIKNFATWARRTLREQVRARAAQFGISPSEILAVQVVGGGLIVAGQTLNADEAEQYRLLRSHLQDLMQIHKQALAVEALIDEIAYTWFNRLAALRFMEVNGYLTTRVLSSSDSKLVDPDVLRDAGYIAESGEFPGLNLDKLTEWRSLASRAPNPDEWLYRRLLVGQCEALAAGLPFLFDRTKNYTALFVPANLLNQDSIVRRLVTDIPEADWRDSSDSENGVEIIGWLYQFYISERKDEVIGAKSKVAAQDIPAATQLFTPHWIVRYMVENSLGRLWLESHPESQLRQKMPYYLEPAPEDGEAEEPIKLIPLQPQELTVCDPACGSGHILVYAFDLLFEIYREQGYLERDIPALILTHNLFGLDIDERAVQLASFAVLMKARAKNSRILRKLPHLNITAVRTTRNLSLPPVGELKPQDWLPLLEAFKDADHLGSLITPPLFDREKLLGQVEALEQSGSVFTVEIAALRGVVLQAELLRRSYWVVVANPPYMGSKSMNSHLKDFAQANYPDSKSDLFAVFVEHIMGMTLKGGYIGLMSPFTWMFLSSYENLRKQILNNNTLTSLIRPEYHAFFDSAYVPICSFTLCKKPLPEYQGTFIDLSQFYGADLQPLKTLEAIANPNCGYLYYAKATDFAKIPGSAIAYWVGRKILEAFETFEPLENIAEPRQGLATANNDRFLRLWFEVQLQNVGFNLDSRQDAAKSKNKWFSYNKGGEFRKWYGNQEFLVNWEKDGLEIRNFGTDDGGKQRSRPQNTDKYFKPGITWSFVSSSYFGVRYSSKGFIFDVGGSSLFADEDTLIWLTSLLCSKVIFTFMTVMNPTLNFQVGNVASIPVINFKPHTLASGIAQKTISISRKEWDNFEFSWDFQTHPLLRDKNIHQLAQAFETWKNKSDEAFQQLKQLEEQNNRYWIDAYGLQDELTPEVPNDQITIRRADLSRDICSLISYAVGCMMGRYSLDKPGLIHAGQPFDPSQHQTFPADSDAILPITDQAYFDDDIVSRIVEFIRTAYGESHLKENLDFIANALTLRTGESAQDRIRRYFLTEFISDHIQTYKKRPIYWLFTSGKTRAFSALVYLHRYTPNTVAQLRTDYVLELQRKLAGECDRTQKQLDTATNSTAKKTIQKRLKTLRDQDKELADYQAKLQTVADRRIQLDLDDGVAYNYTRFKGLVYEGADLKMADLEKKAQWKLDMLKQADSQSVPLI